MLRMTTMALVGLLAGGFALVGCDREVAHQESTRVGDGKVKTTETTVTEKADGSTQVTKEKTTKDLDDGTTKTQTQTKTTP